MLMAAGGMSQRLKPGSWRHRGSKEEDEGEMRTQARVHTRTHTKKSGGKVN